MLNQDYKCTSSIKVSIHHCNLPRQKEGRSQLYFKLLGFPLLIMSNHQHTLNIENGKACQNSGEHKARTVCCRETVIEKVESCKAIIARVCGRIRKQVERIKPLWPKESWKTVVLWISLIVIDPLICYVPAINDQENLLDFDKSLSAILLVLYGIIYVLKLRIYVYKVKKLNAGSYSKLWWVFVVLAPLVPVLINGLLLFILIIKPTTIIRASIFSIGMAIFFFLSLARVLGIYKLFIAAASPSDKKMKTAVFRIVVNLLLYLYGGHLFGSLWYFFAVWKKMECWNKACTNHSDQCYYGDHRFIVTSGNKTILNDICFNKTEDTTYELGIFKDALASRIVETSNFGKKLLYCFRWGIQNISGYGQNLEVSTHAWENIFVILLAIYGTTTFIFFIGNMQNLIKTSTSKSEEETGWTEQVLKKWSPFEKLSEELQKRVIKECAKFSDRQMGEVDVKNLLSNLPKDVQNNIKRELCSKLLGKVEYFQSWNKAKLENLCNCVKPVVQTERSRIVSEGDPIFEMWFVLQGEVYSSRVVSTNSANSLEFWGEELFPWAQNNSNIPTSNRTIQALTKVEAFVLTANDFTKLCDTC